MRTLHLLKTPDILCANDNGLWLPRDGGVSVRYNDVTKSQARHAKLTAHVQWLVCREVCIPGKAYLGLDLRVVQKATEEINSLISAAVNSEPVRLPNSVTIGVSGNRNRLTLNIVTGKERVPRSIIQSMTIQFATPRNNWPSRRLMAQSLWWNERISQTSCQPGSRAS